MGFRAVGSRTCNQRKLIWKGNRGGDIALFRGSTEEGEKDAEARILVQTLIDLLCADLHRAVLEEALAKTEITESEQREGAYA